MKHINTKRFPEWNPPWFADIKVQYNTLFYKLINQSLTMEERDTFHYLEKIIEDVYGLLEKAETNPS